MQTIATYDAFYNSHVGPAAPSHAEIDVVFKGATAEATLQAARDLADRFPKYVKAYACPVSAHRETDYAMVRIRAKLAVDGVNGGANETGMKRLRAAEKVLAAAGIEPAFGDRPDNWINVYRDRAAFDAAIA